MKIRTRIIVVHAVCATAILALSAGQAAAVPITNQIMINPIQVCEDGGGNCAQVGFFEAETDKIWAQAGIDIQFMATTQLNETDYLNITLAGHAPLFVAGNALVGDPETTKILNMYFVDTIGAGTSGFGCGAPIFAASCPAGQGIAIAGNIFSFNGGIGRLDTIAHEIGHVVGLTHGGFGAGGAENFMTSGGSRSVPGAIGDIAPDGLNIDQMTAAQVTEVLRDPNSRFVKDINPVPEPGAVPLFAAGFVLVALQLRRRPR
jgi:hypothetical protein